jgi:hypothetical protein
MAYFSLDYYNPEQIFKFTYTKLVIVSVLQTFSWTVLQTFLVTASYTVVHLGATATVLA